MFYQQLLRDERSCHFLVMKGNFIKSST